MVTVDRMTDGGFSGASKCVRCADGMRGEYIVRWRSVLSLMRSRLDASAGGKQIIRVGSKVRMYKLRTKEAKVSSMDDCTRIGLPGEVIQRGEAATDRKSVV